MSELKARSLLRSVHNAAQAAARHPEGHEFFDDAIQVLDGEIRLLTSHGGETCLLAGREAFYLDDEVLPHMTTEYHGLLRSLQESGIHSIAFRPNPLTRDLVDLARLVGKVSDGLPSAGSVEINGRQAPSEAGGEISELRSSYGSSLDALRSVAGDGEVDLGAVWSVVDGLLTRAASDFGGSVMLASVHNHDEYTYYHSVNVCLLSLAFGKALGLADDHLRHLGAGALLHDIGKVVVSGEALRKPDSLSNEEWASVRLHPQEGALAIMSGSGQGRELAAVVALEHHVGVDGSGYPNLSGRKPHLFSRIVGVLDSYDAMTSDRPHRKAFSPNQALRMLLDRAGSQYDDEVVRALARLLGNYPPGSLLRMSDGSVLMVTGSLESREALLIRDTEGRPVAPRPARLDVKAISRQLLPEEVGVDPSSLLESAKRHHPSEA